LEGTVQTIKLGNRKVFRRKIKVTEKDKAKIRRVAQR